MTAIVEGASEIPCFNFGSTLVESVSCLYCFSISLKGDAENRQSVDIVRGVVLNCAYLQGIAMGSMLA